MDSLRYFQWYRWQYGEIWGGVLTVLLPLCSYISRQRTMVTMYFAYDRTSVVWLVIFLPFLPPVDGSSPGTQYLPATGLTAKTETMGQRRDWMDTAQGSLVRRVVGPKDRWSESMLGLHCNQRHIFSKVLGWNQTLYFCSVTLLSAVQ